MTKILAKIARRNNSNELPDRRELVEMDLFDTDRNPWPGKLGGGGIWIRHDFNPAVPFAPLLDETPDDDAHSVVGLVDMVVERTSLALAFIGGVFDVASGAGDNKSVSLRIQADGDGGAVMVQTDQTFLTNASGYRTHDYDAYGYSILHPGTYSVRVFAWTTNSGDPPDPVLNFTEFMATIALLPAGLAAISGWGGTGG